MKLYYAISGYSASNKDAYKSAMLFADIELANSHANAIAKAVLTACKLTREALPGDLAIVRTVTLADLELRELPQYDGSIAYAYIR